MLRTFFWQKKYHMFNPPSPRSVAAPVIIASAASSNDKIYTYTGELHGHQAKICVNLP